MAPDGDTASTLRDLEPAMARVWEIARRLGLEPYPVHFELVPATIMYEFGAYGLPGRFSHWTHGRGYQKLKTMYDHGLSKIYEMVVNANPAHAFLVENNSVLQNTVVAAHVLGHVDFFANNSYFVGTNRQMIEGASVNAERIRRHEYRHGQREVEEFLDAVLSIQEHVDPAAGRVRQEPHEARRQQLPWERPYDDLFYLGSEKRPVVEEPRRNALAEPATDLLLFISEHAADLEDWQRDIIDIVRAEQLYFRPQMQTKIMNEGWASLWHARIMREMDLASADYMEFSQMHASVLATSRRHLNPYTLGMRVFEDIERRWDAPSPEERDRGRQPGEGRGKIFEVRALESDASFLRNYLTADLVEALDLYLYRLEGDTWVIVEKDWAKVRDAVVHSMTNHGQPVIVVEDGDFNDRGELFLRHCFEGDELDLPYVEGTLRYLFRLWGKPVHLATRSEDKPIVVSCDGHTTSTTPAA